MTLLSKLLPAVAGVFIAVLLVGTTEPPRRAEAHPLGNFTVNRLVVIDLDAQGLVTLRYVVDRPEIPTFQTLRKIDLDGDGSVSALEESSYLETAEAELLAGLRFEVEGSQVALEASAVDLEVLPGQGGLSTMRIVIDARGDLPDGWSAGVSASLRDDNFNGEPGWRQIVVRPGTSVRLLQGDVATADVTAELTEYPSDRLNSPPSVSSAVFFFDAGSTLAAPANTNSESSETISRDAAGKTLGRFASIVSRENLTPGFIALALLLTAGWDAMHALGPGHGKTVVAAYLVGERGTWRHAVYLGLIVTATHTISVFTLGAIAIFASNLLSADDMYNWLSTASGALVAVVGGVLLVTRLRRVLASRSERRAHEHAHAQHESHSHRAEAGHSHEHGDGGEHGHSHVPTAPGWRGLLALGVSGGLVPCPTALVVMLGAIAIDRIVFGLVLVSAFSVGLASVLTAVGLVLVFGRRKLAQWRSLPLGNAGFLRAVTTLAPVMSALTIRCLGVVIAGRSTL